MTTVIVQQGDVLEYAREETGQVIPLEGQKSLILLRGKQYVAGIDIQLPFAQQLVDDGKLKVQEAVAQVNPSAPVAVDVPKVSIVIPPSTEDQIAL